MRAVGAYFSENWAEWLQMVGEHLWVSAAALALALLVAVPLGVACSRSDLVDRVATNVAGVLRIVPSLAVLVLAVPVLGVGELPAVVALAVLVVPPVLVNVAVGLRSVPPEVVEAARGMGMGPARLFLAVRAPLAFPVAFAGVRTAAVEVVASATLAAYIGAGGLGVLIYTGIGALRSDLLWIGGVSVAALSLAVGGLLALVDRRVRRYERARG